MQLKLTCRFLPVRSLLGLAIALALIPLAHTETVPNRTVPKVHPPQAGLHFTSGTPSTAEISRARVFEEQLAPIGGEPTSVENGALAAALVRYSQRNSPDDFASLTDFLVQHPHSPWRAALLTSLGLDYYNTAHYSLALDAWQQAWSQADAARDVSAHAVVSRAGSELAYLYARLGRMTELEALLKSVNGRVWFGGAGVKMNGAREALWTMNNRPEISFRCGPLALQSIMHSAALDAPGDMAIFNSASTQDGFSLPQVAELSKQVGLNYQMAFRGKRGDFVVPSVVHWKVGHYAAIIQQVGDRYLVQDPTFGNTVWPTREALEAETSGYFLIPRGELPPGWRSVGEAEGVRVWGKGVTSDSDSDRITDDDMATDACGSSDQGMPVSSVHLMVASLQLRDTPVGYIPPVGPAVPFRVRYNQRDPRNTFGFSEGLASLGPKWTSDWFSWITDNPFSPLADVKCQVGGGGANTYTGFNPTNQTFALQQLDQTLLRRTGTNSYEQIARDGSKKIFAQPNGAIGTSRNIYLTQVVDPDGNAVTLTYDTNLLLVAITDAIGQVTTLTYGVPAGTNGGVSLPANPFLISRVTDPFGRYATFDYGPIKVGDNISYTPPNIPNATPIYAWAITGITDVMGLNSQFTYALSDITYIGTNSGGYPVLILYNDVITSMVTPYGTNIYLMGGGGTNGNGRFVERHYPDGSRDRVVYSQNTNGIAFSDPPALVPQGMNVFNLWMHGRNTFYWSRNASAQAYGDYSKAKIYHWLHMPNIAATAGLIESVKSPHENRVWFSYAGQASPHAAGSSDLPTRIGRVLDDGSTQLYSYAYNGFGQVTNAIDPVGRELSYLYATNGIDLLEVRQTRGANNELLARITYNNQHCPLTLTDAAGQTTTNTFNARGQLLTTSNPKGETTTYTYDADGYLNAVDGPLPGASDVVTTTYDVFGRTRTVTDESGYTLTYDYDAMDRLTRVTYPDTTFNQYTYNRLDLVSVLDSAGRLTSFEYDNMRQLKKHTDPLSRVTRFEWCSCGGLERLTDPMGRTTEWRSDVQGRPVSKQYGDGSIIRYYFENTTSRLRQVVDEKQQVTHYGYNRDNTLKSVSHINASVPTPAVSFTYDPDYKRIVFMTDGNGTTRYSYNPITTTPTLGAGELVSEDGPLADDTITFGYDELGRLVHRAINGVDLAVSIDPAGRRVGRTSALGEFTYAYDGASDRIVSRSLPGSQTETRAYGNTVQDLMLQRITYTVGATPVSEFLYGQDVPKGRVATWSQQVGVQSPNQFSFGYDAVNQLLSAVVTNAGTLANTFAYTYDPVGNRLTEQVGSSNHYAAYNTLNQITTGSTRGNARTNEWDALDRLVAVNAGNQRTEFTYDGLSRMVEIRQLVNSTEVARRLFVWCGLTLCEERDAAGAVIKRFFGQGMKVESGPDAGNYYYTRDHLSSIREITDASGNVRARYAYDPYGRRTKLAGDMEADFGFAGMFWCGEANLNLTLFRAYDPELGRWLSRDPLHNGELRQGPNLYAYVANDPVNLTDPSGLLSWSDPGFLEWAKGRYNPDQFERIKKKYEGKPLWSEPRSPRTPQSPPNKSPGPGGDITDYLGNGDIVEVEKRAKPGWQRPRRQPYRPPEPRRSPRSTPSYPGIGGPLTVFVESGITILTMTDCNTVNGILGLVRQGKGGSVNIYQDRMLKELDEIDPVP